MQNMEEIDMFKTKFICIFFTSLSFSILVHAQGGDFGGGYIGDRPAEQRSHDYYKYTNRNKTDPAYEIGKSIFKGRRENAPKLNYCISDEQNVVELKRKTIKRFKKSTYVDLEKNLYNCDKPDELVSQSLSEYQLTHVLYYLDKRFRLKLSK